MVLFFEGQRANTKIYHDGIRHFYYTKSKGTTSTTYLSCVQKDCPGTASFRNSENLEECVLDHKKEHNHPEDVHYRVRKDFRKRLNDRVTSEEVKAVTIFKEECQKIPVEVASAFSYASLANGLYKYKAKKKNLRETRMPRDAPQPSPQLTPPPRVLEKASKPPSSWMTAPHIYDNASYDRGFLKKQLRDIKHSLSSGHDVLREAEQGEAKCCICILNCATRTAIPCGHKIYCLPCANEIVETPERVFLYCDEDTNENVYGEDFKPVACAVCRALVFSLNLVYN